MSHADSALECFYPDLTKPKILGLAYPQVTVLMKFVANRMGASGFISLIVGTCIALYESLALQKSLSRVLKIDLSQNSAVCRYMFSAIIRPEYFNCEMYLNSAGADRLVEQLRADKVL